MKKMMIVVLAILVCASIAMGQTYTQGTGITGYDKLGAHQNGGRGCVGCHAPHSGGRGNGGVLKWNDTTKAFDSVAVTDQKSGDDALWGQDIGPIVALGNQSFSGYAVGLNADFTAQPRILTGVVFCLSCHDGNVAKGAMMTNQSFEQVAKLLPASYGTQAIPTLLGNDGGATGNYENDHPIGPNANIAALGTGTNSLSTYVDLDSAKTKVIAKGTQPNANYTNFIASYGSPVVLGARVGAGFVVESSMTSSNQAYVVCTTCHTPHTMYTSTASASNPIMGLSAGTFPTYFFLAAPYNPGADIASGKKASSATQFCRQCHFTGAGGSNEASGINGIATSF